MALRTQKPQKPQMEYVDIRGTQEFARRFLIRYQLELKYGFTERACA